MSEFHNFYEQTVPAGWVVRNGAVLANAGSTVPQLLTYLQQPANAWKCKTLEEWTALSNAAGGVGGAPFLVVDVAADTIKLPDTRGDYERSAGSSYLETVGAWHGDAIRNITAEVYQDRVQIPWFQGAFYQIKSHNTQYGNNLSSIEPRQRGFDASRVVPTASENRTRSYGLLGCVYVGASS